MAIAQAEHCCFLRTNTAQGGVTQLAQLAARDNLRTLYIKGGHGGAAAALLAALEELAKEKGTSAQPFWDAPGRERRCAVLLPELNLAVIDAEVPWPLEPKLPGAGEELLSLDSCRDNTKLREQRDELLQLSTQWQHQLARVAQFMRSAQAIKRDMTHVASETLNLSKIERYASRFAQKHFTPPSGKVGLEQRRFLTAVTGKGLLLRSSVLAETCSQAVILDDENGVAAPLLWELVRSYALGNGVDCISCPCLLDPAAAPEHLIFPQLGLACITNNLRHPIKLENAQHISATRFIEKSALQAHKNRLRFCRRAMRELLAEAYEAQAAADLLRGEIDAIYANALIPGAVENMAKALLSEKIAHRG
ncbi:MAG: hypothetical protein FWD06_06795 [Oscillospiraceae bacterium]|nr:hypothetical protein [Oscillospiraceae bacterium]